MSLHIHRELYLSLRLAALCGIFLPAFVLLLRMQEGVEHKASIALILALILVLFLACTSFGLAQHVRWGLRLCRRHFAVGYAYASLEGPWWRNSKWKLRIWQVEIAARTAVALIGFCYLAATIWFVCQVLFLSDPGLTFFVYRTIQLDSGLSPLLPLFFTGTALAVWCGWHLERIRLLKKTTAFEAACIEADLTDPATVSQEGFIEPSALHVDEVWKRLLMLIPTINGAFFMAVLVLMGAVLWSRYDRTLESLLLTSLDLFNLNAFDCLLRFGILMALGTTIWAVYRFHLVWRAFRKVLDGISSTPLLPAFERLPQQISQVTRLTFLKPSSVDTVRSVIPTQWLHLRSLYNLMDQTEQRRIPENGQQSEPGKTGERSAFAVLREKNKKLASQIDKFMKRTEPPEARASRVVASRVSESAITLNQILQAFWKMEPTETEIAHMVKYMAGPDALAPSPLSNTSSRFRRSFADPVRLWLRAAEEFAAVQVVDYIEWVLQHLRRLALFLFLSLLLTTALISCYPFQPQSLFKLIFFFVLVGTVGMLLVVMIQMNRDEVLSRIAKNDPGRISWDTSFVINIILLVSVPLLALASSEFPSLRGFLFAWIEPLLKTLGAG